MPENRSCYIYVTFKARAGSCGKNWLQNVQLPVGYMTIAQ